ncbi:MAG: UDP-N-acetylglucosamine--N-acetylmuramyl-(pentapeptide) pyrophosphoryl-undecaprenol N-acetylglucosamine transferase [Parvularculaceae bacterium]
MTAPGARLVALAAGGTGGHMFPAEALAQELKRRGRRVLLVTDARGARYATNFPADERFMISAASPSIGGPVAKAAAAVSIAGGLMTAMREFRKRQVCAAVGFGGYPSFPAMKAAALMNIPYGVHEQNGVLGRANRMVSAGACFVAHGFPVLERVPARARDRLVEVGNPVRDIVNAAAHTPFNAPGEHDRISLLVFGGSQGASLFSRIAPAAIADLPPAVRTRLFVTHQARDTEADAVRQTYRIAGVECEVAPFFADLPERIARADIVLGRAGASTVTELSVIGRPSILVPLAIAMDDHQSGNARALAEADAAVIIPETEFTTRRLSSKLHDILTDPALLAHMAASAKGRVKTGAAVALADLVDAIADEKTKAAA